MVEKSLASSSQIRRFWNFASCDDSRNKRQADLSGYPEPERHRHSHPHPGLAIAGEPCSWILSREYGVALGRFEKVRELHLGNRQGNSKDGGGGLKVLFFHYVPHSTF